MYTLAVKKEFIAQHYLVGGDWGAENELHSHHYQLELRIQGKELDSHGYLVDIVDIEATLTALMGRYRDRTLNDLPEFSDINPSLEHFARILCRSLAAHIQAGNVRSITVVLWENEIAWASYDQEI